ncbi:uncharacterized protein LOC8285666 [Ricinus communis]|uniref:Plant/T31B5-30 protein n=1 Tax=Ricinus communis TaxID=3988 RepID=B9RFX4_RICCO|nr:uncharacterized protein LOC8285666 [Ricinus communis]EEF50095.1 conserved hypothetical protein [Ricinus communis]|eukprot:XP_002512643.1 uncharacterized protein LOC8285666 [Ricinus communis]
MAPTSLLGPPELHNADLLKKSKNDGVRSLRSVSDPFMDLMISKFNTSSVSESPQMGYTENNSSTYLSSGDPCIDFFFHVVPKTRSESIRERLYSTWQHNPLTTLKLICNLRGVRDTGKSDKEGFYTAAIWLHQFHPKTLACNVPHMADFGYFKDFPEILYRLLDGDDVRVKQKAEWRRRKSGCGGKRRRSRFYLTNSTFRGPFARIKKKNKRSRKGGKPHASKERRVKNSLQKDKIEKEKASLSRKWKKVAMAKKVFDRYSRDPDFRFLYDRVSDFFANCLKSDIEYLKSGQIRKVSLAAKWCPSIDSSFDKSTLLCESVARKIFTRELYPEYEGVEEVHYAYRIRDRLRKEVLVPLRKVLELPEVYMGHNKWGEIPYNRVASVAMKFYKEKFLKHDADRFIKYLEDVKSGKSKLAAGALLPHEIIKSLNDDDGGQVAELQWKRMVDDLLQKGKLRNSMAISDVSSSMDGIPMEVSVAMGVLVSELSDEPWKGKLISFTANPTLQCLQGDSLLDKTQFVRNMEWGNNTDFQKVFDLILHVAVNGKLKEDQMIKRVFVFSAMEFDRASTTPWETDYKAISRKFTEKGYGNVIPEIVFWNLRNSMATPVPGKQNGVALVSGFSKNLLKMFLERDGTIDPVSVMEAAISGEEYQKLVVLD